MIFLAVYLTGLVFMASYLANSNSLRWQEVVLGAIIWPLVIVLTPFFLVVMWILSIVIRGG